MNKWKNNTNKIRGFPLYSFSLSFPFCLFILFFIVLFYHHVNETCAVVVLLISDHQSNETPCSRSSFFVVQVVLEPLRGVTQGRYYLLHRAGNASDSDRLRVDTDRIDGLYKRAFKRGEGWKGRQKFYKRIPQGKVLLC